MEDCYKALLLGTTSSVPRPFWKFNRQSAFWNMCCHTEDVFKTHFRITRKSFSVLCELLKSFQKKDTNWRKAVPLDKRVAIALCALGSSGEYRVVCELFAVGKSTVCTIVLEFCSIVWEVMSPTYLKRFPLTQETVAECVKGFELLGFPQCLGALDGCHIKIRPNSEDAVDYYNYKGWHSIVLLALVDFRYRFMYVNVGTPGRCNDSYIFETSNLKKMLNTCNLLRKNKKNICNLDVPVYIIADSAFRLTQTLMKPYPFNVDMPLVKKNYNYKLSKCRRVVENAFGHLKARFRRIGKGLDNRINNANIIVSACCVLHNFLNENNDHINAQWLKELKNIDKNQHPDQHPIIFDMEPIAEEIRQAVATYLSCGDDIAVDDEVVGTSDNIGGNNVDIGDDDIAISSSRYSS
ncbi:protein ANTAGONIST OF LIKE HETEROCHROMATIN PROTEIN 1-like [Teleopsis dalmanni]|uniref:protein ANTAGONIST OF LIKE HETEROCHROMATIN PROTEIN 1-like n=1 Tax=Teleopsis dalmanni TaxID=139649 RepID=UPI0018CCC68B|nr:protein ANTAGONIST OF LIKE HETEROCHROMATIN PROTEIN 1-like [Teleopsis dalmanni]XP_037950306.1 protein ANTAGONIST OF LIKE HETEROCHROMATIN PROTEIN 1-like [Teleopsis dalmanni]XP_037951864.1 protein ANTAGONIST OF LIKE HETEROCHROMATIN PROTEIN 1-like [Teleopsis dalmanni]